MKKTLKTIVLLVFISAALNSGLLLAEDYTYDDPYFSFERFLPAMLTLENVPEQSGPQGEINKFAKSFSDGLYALTAEEYPLALHKLLEARTIWPEYFGTDFLIALVYEGRGDPRSAARYYKSYLHKLKTLEAGEYPISGRMIQSITTSEADSYDIADELIRSRLTSQGIDLKDVTIPLSLPPHIFLFTSLMALSLLIYMIIHYFIKPYIKQQKKINTLPSEGYWICKNCGTPNLLLRKECEECGRLG